MKICLFTDLRFTESPAPTGVGKHIYQMACGLAGSDGADLFVLAARDQANADGLHSNSALSFLPTCRLPLPWKAAEAIWTLAGGPAVDKYCSGADWVYCPKNDFIPLRRTRVAITIHGAHELDPELPQSKTINARLSRMRRRLSYRRIVERADLILTVSEFLKGQVVEWFEVDDAKIVVVGNGVENCFFEEARQNKPAGQLNADSLYLLCVGGLNDIDGGHEIVSTAELLKVVIPELQILVAGCQHEPYLLRKAKALPNISLLGYVEAPRLAVLMRNAMAFLFLTRYETFGIAAAEAMAAGTPVITSGGTAVPEIVGEAGLYVSRQPEDIVENIKKLYENQSMREYLGLAGRQRAERFTWQQCVERLVHALKANS